MNTKKEFQTSIYAQITYEIDHMKDFVPPAGSQIIEGAESFTHTVVSLLRPYGEDSFTCKGCGKDQNYTKPKLGTIVLLACGSECGKKIGFVKAVDTSKFTNPAKPDKPINTNICPTCKGPSKGRGYQHKDDCSEKATNQTPVTDKPEKCSECGGQKRGRGYKHTDKCRKNCHNKPKQVNKKD